MEQTIKSLLTKNYTDGVFHTHVSLITPRGKFQFNRQCLEEFWKNYCDLVQKYDEDEEEFPSFGIGENPQQYIPVLVDVDLKIKDIGQEIGETLYSELELRTVVEAYQSVLRDIVEDCNDIDLTCVVLEKKMYIQNRNESTYIKNGFHLHFPYLFIDRLEQELHLIPRVKEIIKNIELFKSLGIEHSGDIIDKSCCKNHWLVYMSKKSEDSKPYKVSKVYNADLEDVPLEKAFSNYVIYDYREQPINVKNKVKYYMPRILSIIPYGRPSKNLKRGLLSPLKEEIRKKESKNIGKEYDVHTVEQNLKIAKELLPMIADFRSTDRNEWMTIGWVLYNISEGSSEGLELWCDFSARDEDKYDESRCIYEWDRMIKKDMSIGTLKHFAGVDSPEQYSKYKERECEKHIVNSLEGSHNDIAKAMFEQYGEHFVCASISNKRWYQFIGHHWEVIEEGYTLREKISSSVVQKYIDAIKSIYTEIGNCQEKDKSKESILTMKAKQLGKMIKDLKHTTYKNNVMREAAEVFYNPKFSDKLNSDPYLFCFKNGVYDFRNNVFRKGMPEDYISKSVPWNYLTFSEDDEGVQEVKNFFEKVFPDKSVRQYVLDWASDIFIGGNHEKTVQFWVGDGDNGKSVTQKLFELTLGKFAIKWNTSVITGKKPGAGNAFADLARAGDGTRLAVLEEPDPDESINIGIFKHLSGNDAYFARDLHEKGKETKEIVPMFKLIFICNKLPKIKYADRAVNNRIRVVPFESTFCRPDQDIPDTYEEQLRLKRFPMDKQFAKKLPKLVEPFIWILLEHRKNVTVKTEPEKVRIATANYVKQNDIYKQFIDENIVAESNSIMSLTSLYEIFKNWFKDSLPNQTLPVKIDVEEYFTKLWGFPESGKKWKGYRQRTAKDDKREEDGDSEEEEEKEEKNSGLPRM